MQTLHTGSMTIEKELQYLGIMPAGMIPLDEKSQKLDDKSFVLVRLVVLFTDQV